MKFFIAFALIATVASAAIIKPTQLTGELAEIAEIVAAIQSPSTNPATAAALEALLLEVMGVQPAPIAVGPAIVDSNPISVGPAIVDFPMPDGGALTAVETPVLPSPVVAPSPVVIGDIPAGASPLVQIIVNVQGQESAVAPAPVDNAVVDEVIVPGPVNIVDNVFPVVEPIQVVNPVIVDPIQVVNPVVPGPVNVVDNVVVEPVIVGTPVIVDPVQVGTPIIPAPAVVLPEELN